MYYFRNYIPDFTLFRDWYQFCREQCKTQWHLYNSLVNKLKQSRIIDLFTSVY